MLIALIFLMSVTVNDSLNFTPLEESFLTELTLDQAIDYALVNNPEIINLQIELEKAQAQVGQALSHFYPSITATGYYAYINDVPVFDLDGMLVPMGEHKNYDVQVSLQQVLFAWGKIYHGYKITDLNKKIAELNLIRKKQEIRYSVTDGFYSLLVLEQMVALSQEGFVQLQRHEDAVRKRYEAGLVAQFELLRAQVQVANLKPQVIEAENGLKLAQEGFKMLIGAPLEIDIKIAGELPMVEEDFILDSLTSLALENRAELKTLKNVESIAKLGQSIAARANLPILVAGATYDRKKPYGFGGNEWGSNVTFNVGFEFPLFTGFKNFYQYKEASADLKQAHLAFDNLTKAITLEVKQAYFNFLASKEAVIAAQDNVGQAEKAFEIIDTRYKNGLATNLEFLDVQLALMQAKTNQLFALKNYYASRAQVYKAVGE